MSLSTLVDWGDFEEFVKRLYASDVTVTAERDVTVIGKSGARRQLDVRVTMKTALHTYVTVAECKRWKEPVGRDRIDVLAATIEDIGAQKGVMFTTTGYEEGALLYAKSKSIDLFLVRDLTDEEWGLPGRNIHFYLHYVVARCDGIGFPNAVLLAPSGWRPPTNIDFGARGEPDRTPTLYARDGTAGPSLRRVIISIRESVMKAIGNRVPLIDGGREKARILYRQDLTGILSDAFTFRELRYPSGTLEINRLTMTLWVQVTQDVVQWDRASKVDLAVAIVDYLDDRKKLASQQKGTTSIDLRDIKPRTETEKADVLQNGSIMKIYMDEFVGFELGDISTAIVLPPVTLNIDPPSPPTGATPANP